MALSQDQAKITVQILNSLKYTPQDGKVITEIITELSKDIVDKTLDIPSVSVELGTANVTIDKQVI
jgi:hypothetical protein